jgi:hypothetical protein
MQLASEIVYPIYLAGASDRYFHFDYNVQKMVIINNYANHCFIIVKSQLLREETSC